MSVSYGMKCKKVYSDPDNLMFTILKLFYLLPVRKQFAKFFIHTDIY
jgi:hypothetical protein